MNDTATDASVLAAGLAGLYVPGRLTGPPLETLGYQPVYCTWNPDSRNGDGEWTPQKGTTGGYPFPAAAVPPAVPYRPALRPPPHVLIQDVDDHDGAGTGPATIAKMEAVLGPLPSTWRLTARGPGCPAARYLYGIPAGLIVNNKPFLAYGGQVDAVRTGWRFSWAPGDVHPKLGTPVMCYGPDGAPCDLPPADTVPPYPGTWLAYFRGFGERAAADCAAVEPGQLPDPLPPSVQDELDRDEAGRPANAEGTGPALHKAVMALTAACFDAGLSQAETTAVTLLLSPYADELAGQRGTTAAGEVARCWGVLEYAAGDEPAWLAEHRAPGRMEQYAANPRDLAVAARAGLLSPNGNGQQAASQNGSGTAAPAGPLPAPRPRFDVSNMATAAAVLRGELGRGPLAGLYLRGGTLVHTPRTGEDGYVMPTEDEKARGIDHGPAQVRGVEEGHVRSLVEVRYDVGKVAAVKDKETKEESKVWVPSLFPHDAARHAVKAAELGIGCPDLCHLAGITHTPVIRRDGTVLDRPGYDRGTGLLFLPTGGLAVPAVPEHPTAEQVAEAAALLRRPVALFPWVAPHHEANWLGAMFTPLLRLLLPPPYQLLIITATNRGSGKTLLLKLLGIVHGMATRGEFPRDKDELRKLFFSTLLTTTAPVIGMDNVRGTIYSGELESLLTAVTLNERELGHSRNVTVTNDRLWVITGNNARIGGDLDRRCLPVALDPRCADPHKRAFKVDPAQWMAAHRGEYIAALLTVARGWVLAGMEPGDAGRSDDYRQWYGAMRGLLAFAGIPGTFGAEDRGDLSVVSEDDQEWGAFVAELSRVFEDERFTTADVIEHLDYAEVIARPRPVKTGMAAYLDEAPHVPAGVRIAAGTLPGELAEKWEATRNGKTSGFARSLGKWLSYRDGRFTADGMTVRVVESRPAYRTARFAVEAAG